MCFCGLELGGGFFFRLFRSLCFIFAVSMMCACLWPNRLLLLEFVAVGVDGEPFFYITVTELFFWDFNRLKAVKLN